MQPRSTWRAGTSSKPCRRASIPRSFLAPTRAKVGPTIDGVAKDGIQLKVKAKVTVRTNIDRLVGGATDETIIARVGEGIVNAIGAAETIQVLEKPDTISKRVLEKGLDAGTAYRDPLDRHRQDRRRREHRRQQPAAAGRGRHARRPGQGRGASRFAVAKEQEMVADVQENRAKVVSAEAEIPLAIAEAFRQGNLGSTTITICVTSRLNGDAHRHRRVRQPHAARGRGERLNNPCVRHRLYSERDPFRKRRS